MTYKVTLTITEFDNETQAQMAFEALAMAVKDCDELSGHTGVYAVEKVEETGWRPIETAPKDGTWFLGYLKQKWNRPSVRPYRWSKRQFEKHGNGWDFEGDGLHCPTLWKPLLQPQEISD